MMTHPGAGRTLAVSPWSLAWQAAAGYQVVAELGGGVAEQAPVIPAGLRRR